MRSKIASLAVLGILSAFCGTASASPVPWTQPFGSTTYYDYSNGQSTNGLFGNPLVLDGSFIFFPNNFKASAQNGASDTESDAVSFNIAVKPGYSVTEISVAELGDYSILGTGTVQVGGTLTITNLNNAAVTNSSLVSTPSSPITTVGAGSWSASTSQTNLPNGWTLFHVNLSNILDASAGPGSTATIEKKFVNGAIQVSIIVPEPTSIGLLISGSSALLLRRRRND